MAKNVTPKKTTPMKGKPSVFAKKLAQMKEAWDRAKEESKKPWCPATVQRYRR
jgi:hypothetical protein